MRSKNLLFLSLLLAGTGFLFAGCSDDDNEPEIPEVTEGVFVLNNGNQNTNNSTLSYYDLATKKVAADVFQAKNGRKLGDMGQDMVIYGSKVYITVYGSNTIEITDRTGKSIKQLTSADGVDNPRNVTAYEGQVYVTFFTGFVARIDTTTMTLDKKTVKVGRYPEDIVASNGKLYVANSGGMDYNQPAGYDKTVSVIDVNSFTETQKIEVVINPTRLAVMDNGDIYVISVGNYDAKDIPNTIQRIDSKTNKVEVIGNATVMASYHNTLYWIYKQWGVTGTDFVKYDAVTKKVLTENFITDETVIDASMLTVDVDPSTGNIYLGSSTSSTVNGDMYIFSPEGKKLDKFEVGINPQGAFFLTNK